MSTISSRVIRRARKRYGVTVYTHRQFGSRARGIYAARRRNRPVRVRKADTLVQHITVTRPSDDLKADARVVERIGTDRFGSGISYNFLVDMRTGEVAQGQPLDAKGTHTVNDKHKPGFSYDQNHAARAIAVVGMPDTPLSARAHRAIAGLIAAMMDEGAITESPDYLPHSFFAWKDCPCDATRNAMPQILRDAKALRRKHRKPAAPKETNVSTARGYLHKARKYAKKHGLKPRLRKIRRALKRLPKR